MKSFMRFGFLIVLLLICAATITQAQSGRAARRNAARGNTVTASQGGATATRQSGGAVSPRREVRGRSQRPN